MVHSVLQAMGNKNTVLFESVSASKSFPPLLFYSISHAAPFLPTPYSKVWIDSARSHFPTLRTLDLKNHIHKVCAQSRHQFGASGPCLWREVGKNWAQGSTQKNFFPRGGSTPRSNPSDLLEMFWKALLNTKITDFRIFFVLVQILSFGATTEDSESNV